VDVGVAVLAPLLAPIVATVERPVLQQYLSGLWDDLKAAMLRDAASPDPVMTVRLETGMTEFAEALKAQQPCASPCGTHCSGTWDRR
jgi:hypothetical protein